VRPPTSISVLDLRRLDPDLEVVILRNAPFPATGWPCSLGPLEEKPPDADRRDMSDRSKLTGWEIVRQAEASHPEWTLEQHVAHLNEDEGWDIDPIWVARWLRNIAADKSV
jgi:hypothetical protein